MSPAPRRRRVRLNPSVVEESPTRARRPRRLVDLFAVLTEGTSTTSTAPLAQNIVELYGLLPTVAMMATLSLFLLSSASQPEARAWAAHWTVWVELKSGGVNGNSKAFMTVHALERVWTPLLSSFWPRWASRW